MPGYTFDMIVADNASTDGSRELLRRMAAKDSRVKVILNANNFGHIRSPYNALLQADGDAAIVMCSDLQEPPEMIPAMLREWEAGAKIVCCVKPESRENPLMFAVRRFYYWLLDKFSETPQLRNFTGFGLYDRRFLDALKLFHEAVPVFPRSCDGDRLQARRIAVRAGQAQTRTHQKQFFHALRHGDDRLRQSHQAAAAARRIRRFPAGVSESAGGGRLPGLQALLLGYLPARARAAGHRGFFLLLGGPADFHRHHRGVCRRDLDAVKNKPLAVEEEKINFDR